MLKKTYISYVLMDYDTFNTYSAQHYHRPIKKIEETPSEENNKKRGRKKKEKQKLVEDESQTKLTFYIMLDMKNNGI